MDEALEKEKATQREQRASDEALREELRHFDVKKFGKLLQQAVNRLPVPQKTKDSG